MKTEDFKEKEDGYFYTELNSELRVKKVKDIDPFSGDVEWDWQFEILRRPYFFGLIGKKRWEMSVRTNGWYEGISFSLYLLNE